MSVNYQVIIDLAIRELEVELHGQKVQVTERLMRDPKPIQEARAKLYASVGKLEEEVSKAESTEDAKTPDEKSAAMLQLKGWIQEARNLLEADDRLRLCRDFCGRIARTNLIGEDGAPMPLEPQKLYEAPVPNELLTAILEGCSAIPLAPKAK